jgi:hypothetical protein
VEAPLSGADSHNGLISGSRFWTRPATSEPGKSPTTGPLEEAEQYTIEDLVLRPKGVEADINALLNPDSDNKQDRDSGMDIDMDTDVEQDLKLEDSGISDAASPSSRFTLL